MKVDSSYVTVKPKRRAKTSNLTGASVTRVQWLDIDDSEQYKILLGVGLRLAFVGSLMDGCP